ncbi:hypothetical protein HanIR_Chr05g0242841 [Helianthus annuus]|nr:hypothetical protein HanIR_Chr05g0242841 [Helianthus annuus]
MVDIGKSTPSHLNTGCSCSAPNHITIKYRRSKIPRRLRLHDLPLRWQGHRLIRRTTSTVS